MSSDHDNPAGADALEIELPDSMVFSFMQASADLLRTAMVQLRAGDHEAFDGIVKSIAEGAGMLQLSATMAPSSGLAQLAMNYIDPAGVSQQLMSCELRRKHHA